MKFCYENLVAVIFCLLAVQSAQAALPSYNGKTLIEWMGEPDQKVRNDAIQQIGTNAIPTLIDILSVKRSNVRRVVSKLQNKELQGYISEDADLDGLRSLAVDGFAALGTNAEPAIPQLTKMFNDDEIRLQAARALTKIGPKGFMVLTNAIAHGNSATRNNLIWAIAEEGGADKKIITELLVNSLKDSDWTVRGNAADFLAGKDPDIAIPVLIPMLDDPEYYPRARAAIALGSFGPAAISAAPKLFSVFTNVISGPDKTLAFDLGVSLLDFALKKINPQTAGKAFEFLFNAPLGVSGYGWTTNRLQNGKILFAGGRIYTTIPTVTAHVFSRAQLYDPITGKSMETGSMNVARAVHMATLLKNGKVLVAGGEDAKNNYLSSVELYDPSTGKWTMTGSMNAPHYDTSAILLPNGKVQVFKKSYNGPSVNLEQYDSATEIWTVITNK